MEPAELNQIYLNMSKPPLDDIRVRKAIAHAINRAEMVAFTGDEVAREAVSVIPQGNLGLNTKPGLLNHDIDKARKLLAEAGHPDGITIKSVQSTLPVLLRTMEAVQAQLRKAGINLEIEPVDHPTYHANIRKDLSGVTLYQAARFPVADVYLTNFFHSRSTVNTPTGDHQLSRIARPRDAEIDAARKETDLKKQKELWALAQKKIVDEVCAVPFSEQLVMWAWKDNLDFGYDVKGIAQPDAAGYREDAFHQVAFCCHTSVPGRRGARSPSPAEHGTAIGSGNDAWQHFSFGGRCSPLSPGFRS